MRRKLLITFLLIPIIHFSYKMYVYRAGYLGVKLVVGRFIECYGVPVKFGDGEELEVKDVELPESTLVLLKPGNEGTLLIIHGLDLMEYIKGTWTSYKIAFKDSVLKALDEIEWNPDVYFYVYPSLLESYWTSGKRLAEFVKRTDLKDVTILAHSRGGLVARVALRYGNFRDRVKRVVFLGTPHTGTPLSDSLTLDPGDFETYFGLSKTVADVMRTTLMLSYNVGLPNSPGGRDMKWHDPDLPPPENYPGVEYVFVGGYVIPKTWNELMNSIDKVIKTRSFAEGSALVYLSILNEMISKTRREFAFTDGLVPISSALALGVMKGHKIALLGYNHSALYRDVWLLKMLLKTESRR